MLKRKFHLILILYHTYTVLLHLSSASTLGATVQFGRKQCSKKITEYSTQYIVSSTLTTKKTLCQKFWGWTKHLTCKEKRIYRMSQVLKSKSKTIPTCCKNWNEMNETICVKVNRAWSAWTSFSVCPVTCGEGIQYRHRSCDDPFPQYNDDYCVGNATESKACNTVNCPVDGGWSIWTDWGSCNVTCGGGTQSRSRFCSNPYPQYGGVNCPGESADTEICNNHTCSGETMKTGNQPNMIQTKNIPIIVPVSVVPPVIVTVIVIGVVCIRMQKRKRSRRGDQGGNDREMNITSSNVFGKPRKNKAPHRYEVSSRNKDKGKKEVSATYDEIVDKNRFMDEYEVPSSCNIQDKYEKHGKIQKPGKLREQNEDLDTEEEQDIYEVLDQYETLDQYESLDQYETLDKQESLNIN